MDTITNTTVGQLSNAVRVAADIDPPAGTRIYIDSDGGITIHPDSTAARRTIFSRPVFAGCCWYPKRADGGAAWSDTTVRGHEVTIFEVRP